MQISDLYKKSKMGGKLNNFFTVLIQNQGMKSSLCDKDLYNNERILLMRSMPNYISFLSDVIVQCQINKGLEYVNKYLVSTLGKNLMNYPNKSDDEVIKTTVQECTSVKLEQILTHQDMVMHILKQDIS